MKTVEQVVRSKGRETWCVSPDATVFEALEMMAARNIGAVLVLDRGNLVGIVSERDYARKVALEGKSSHTTPVREIMSSVTTVRSDQTMEDCMALMTDQRTRHLPVVDHGQLVGLISIGDVVKAIITEQEFMIGQLETYITGRRVRV